MVLPLRGDERPEFHKLLNIYISPMQATRSFNEGVANLVKTKGGNLTQVRDN